MCGRVWRRIGIGAEIDVGREVLNPFAAWDMTDEALYEWLMGMDEIG